MELDILNKENLDSSITNEKSSGFDAINNPIKRGMYVCPKVVMSPYYEYGYSNYSGSLTGIRTALAPKTSIGSTAIPIPISTPTVSLVTPRGISESTPKVSLNPNSNTGLSSPTSYTPFTPMSPMGLNPVLLSQSHTPTPLVTTNNAPTSTPTSTPTSILDSVNTPAPMPIMPMGGGGGGGGVALPSSEESNPEEAPVLSTMKTADVNEKGLSKEVKIGLLVLVAIGGYYAYKKGIFSKI